MSSYTIACQSIKIRDSQYTNDFFSRRLALIHWRTLLKELGRDILSYYLDGLNYG